MERFTIVYSFIFGATFRVLIIMDPEKYSITRMLLSYKQNLGRRFNWYVEFLRLMVFRLRNRFRLTLRLSRDKLVKAIRQLSTEIT